MKPNLIPFLTALLLYTLPAIAQQPSKVMRSVYLVGNAANVSCDDPILTGLRNLTAQESSPYMVLYLGDVIDKDGLEKDDCADEIEKIRGLLEIATNNANGQALFIPGERDWDNAGKSGLKKVKRLEDFLEDELHSKRVLVPTKGCPGPMVMDYGDDLRIIAVNSQWFLHRYKKPEEADADCDIYDIGEFWDEIDDYMEEVPDRNLIIAAHHPAWSYGQYAGYKSFRKHLFPLTDVHEKLYLPLPVIGSFYAAYRQNIGTVKDLHNPEMEYYTHRLKTVLTQYENVIYVSAHELDLQALYAQKNFHINSGAMEKARAVGKGPETLFKCADRGFIKLEFLEDGTILMKVFLLEKDGVERSHIQTLQTSYCSAGTTGIPANNRYVPCPRITGIENAQREVATHVTVTPGPQYDVSKLRRWIFGEHYRTTWSTPISNVPVLNLDTTYGGLIPFATGGGGQTHVLKFQAGDGEWYYFRSVDKDPSLSLGNKPSLMRGWYGSILRDLTSGQYPYGALVANKLMKAAHIYHPDSRLYVMPDDPALGIYRKQYAGMLGLLQIRPRGKNKGVPGFHEADKVVKTVRMFQHLYDDNDNKVDAPSYAKARLLDLLMADWDRQPDNWKFLGYGDKKEMTFYVMPKDRDRAFSKWEGVYWLIDREFASPKIANFGSEYGGYKSLTYKARHIDRMILNEMPWDQWKNLSTTLQDELSDEVIDEAVEQIPEAARTVSGKEIGEKLKTRRDNLMEATGVFYQQLAKYVNIVGSNRWERFEVERLPEGDVIVEMYKCKKTGDKRDLLYSRKFFRNETKEIRLYGLDNEDRFYLKGSADKSILVRIIPGEDQDLIVDQSSVKGLRKHTKVYDKSGEDTLLFSSESRLMYTKDPVRFTYRNYEPNTYLPLPAVIYNQDDGFGLGFGLHLTRHGFLKPGYAKKYYFRGAATTRENYWMTANADFRHVLRMWDLLAGVNITNSERSFRHFYGTGNETVKDNDLKATDYYENLTNIQKLSTGLRRAFWRKSSFSASADFERYKVTDEREEDPGETIYDTYEDLEGMGINTYLGSHMELNLDFRDAAQLPTRGVQLLLSHRYFFNLTSGQKRFGRFSSDLRFYETIRTYIPVTIGIRGGYAQSYGDVPFFYLPRLGQRDNLRGYLRNRFTGDKAVFVNTDLRFDLGTIETAAVPVGIGLFGFTDTGRVWVNGENSDKWHTGYGGGFYLAPIDENFNFTFSFATSEEERLLFEFGFGFMLQ